MPAQVLTSRALNRALLARQMLLQPVPLPAGDDRHDVVLAVVEHLAGLQAQAPFPPYYGLWSRLAGFAPQDLADLLEDRRVVRIALMRGTIHLVSARDCLGFRPLLQPVLDRALAGGLGKQLAGVDAAELATAGRLLLERQPLTFRELGEQLSGRWPDSSPDALAQGVRTLLPLVQVPPRAVWGKSGLARHTSAESWLGRPLGGAPSLDGLFTRYLAAFGPSSVIDMQAWSGLVRMREVAERLRPDLRTFADERGVELFDLPDAPRPDPDTPAPVRLVAEFDNLILSHADRTRVISDAVRARLFSQPNGVFPGSVLVDGHVAGSWRLARARGAATLTVESYATLRAADRDAIMTEGQRLLDFAAPRASGRDIRFTSAQ